jgi:hypothetical protein
MCVENKRNLYSLIKFGEKKYNLELIREGKVRFSSPVFFNECDNEEQGDKYEGSEAIINDRVQSIKVFHPALGEFEFKPLKNAKSQMIQYNSNFLSCSLYSISSKNFETSNPFRIDKKMMKFGDSAVLIKDPYLFLKRIISELNNHNIYYQLDYVDYEDFYNNKEVKTGPFSKKEDHSHQWEFRIIIPNTDNTPKYFYLGDLSEYCELISSKEICELELSARK